MIQVDISNVWGQLSLRSLLAMEKETAAAHAALADGTGPGAEHLGWKNLPVREMTPELERIQKAAQRIRADSDVLVVVGVGNASLGARAVMELLQGRSRNLGRGKGDPQIFFAGNSLSTRQFQELTRLLEGRDFSMAIVSKSGITMEPAIATRSLRWMLERRYGTEEARRRIYAITDPCKGALRQMATEEGWESFVIPSDVGSRYSLFTAAGLLPLAVAGIDIMAFMNGAADVKESCDLRSFENPVWLYAALRNLLYRSGKAIEVFEGFEPDFQAFGLWWQQLFAESEGKDGKGLFPVPAQLTEDLHGLGQMLQSGQRNLFETMVRFAPPKQTCPIESDWKNLDNLNYLEGKTLDFVDEQAFAGVVAAHMDGGVPVIVIECAELCPRTLGQLMHLLQLSCAVSAYLLGVNPFNQPGVAMYKRNMYHLLGKPGYED